MTVQARVPDAVEPAAIGMISMCDSGGNVGHVEGGYEGESGLVCHFTMTVYLST